MMHTSACVHLHTEKDGPSLIYWPAAFSLKGMAVASAYHQTISQNWIV